ncbi:MAG: hypothetical protein QW056_04555, partial [Candidatus Bathyarchaeia archaeon]
MLAEAGTQVRLSATDNYYYDFKCFGFNNACQTYNMKRGICTSGRFCSGSSCTQASYSDRCGRSYCSGSYYIPEWGYGGTCEYFSKSDCQIYEPYGCYWVEEDPNDLYEFYVSGSSCISTKVNCKSQYGAG